VRLSVEARTTPIGPPKIPTQPQFLPLTATAGYSPSRWQLPVPALPVTVDMAPWRAPIRPPELGELETLVACANTGSLTAAGEQLGISRPAVAKRVKNLEALSGQPLLDRGARGVRLTDAGATLLAGARCLLEERDMLVGVLREIRGAGPSPIAGLRALMGGEQATAHAAQLPELRLADTERVLELIMRASSTGVVITDPETAVVHEVNDAFCRFTGRSREELLDRPATDFPEWFTSHDREQVIEQVRRDGRAEGVIVRMPRPDGSVRAGELTVHFIALAGRRLLLTTIDDVGDRDDGRALGPG